MKRLITLLSIVALLALSVPGFVSADPDDTIGPYSKAETNEE